MQHGAVVQNSELVLSATIDPSDALAGQATQASLGEMASNVWMEDFGAPDALA
jgi:hypothetical protein